MRRVLGGPVGESHVSRHDPRLHPIAVHDAWIALFFLCKFPTRKSNTRKSNTRIGMASQVVPVDGGREMDRLKNKILVLSVISRRN